MLVCETCKENFEIEESEDYSSHLCAVCGWPINRVLSKDEVKKFVDGIEKWLEEKKINNACDVFNSLRKLKKREHYLCRYDFFQIVKGMIESLDKKLGKEFEKKIASKYDFLGALVS